MTAPPLPPLTAPAGTQADAGNSPEGERSRPPWPAAAAALVAFAALALSSGAYPSLIGLALGLLLSYAFAARFENVTLTKWTLRIVVIGSAVFAYLAGAVKDDSAFFDMRYPYSLALMMAAELVLQFWRREPTGGARAPFTVFLSAFVFLCGCSVVDDGAHLLWYLAPAFFLFFTLALPGFLPRARVPLALTLAPALFALGLGGATHAGFYVYRGALNALGGQVGSRHLSVSMGMSGQPILGSSFTLRDSLTRVLRLDHPGTDPYLRGMTFDTYAGRTWGPALEGRKFLPYRPPARARGEAEARVTRLDDGVTLLFAPLHSAAVRAEGATTVEWAAPSEGPLRVESTAADPLVYDVVAAKPAAPPGLLDAAPGGDERARDLTLPTEIDPRVLAKAHALGVDKSGPETKIAAVVHFLQTNNAYSLTVNPGAGDPISNFILQRKAAHCEYFASSAVILLRALGVPTRYVSGYFAHENGGKDALLVRQRDAHAWAESWVAGVGWETVDAMPGGGRPDALAGRIPLWWQAWEGIQDVLGALRRWVVSASWAEKGGVFALLVLGLLLPQVYRFWRARRLGAEGFRYSQADAALAALAIRFERLLARRGLPCPLGRTWPEHLRALPRDKALPPRWLAFAQGYDHARFGPPPGPDALARLAADLRALEKGS